MYLLHPIVYDQIPLASLLHLQVLQYQSLLQKLILKLKKGLSPGSERVLGQVWVGSQYEAICILANSVKVVKGKTSKIA